MDAKQKITKARAGLILDQPFFGALALRMALEDDPEADTICTNGKRLRYAPKFIDTLTLEEMKGVLAHEVMHVALEHHLRRGNRDPETWNIAGDMAINGELLRAGMTLPEDRIHDPSMDGKSTDEIYRIIKEQQKQQDGKDSSSAGGGKDPSQGGQGQENSTPSPDPGRCGGVEDYPGKGNGAPTQAEIDQAAAELKVALTQAAQQARSMGRMPGELNRLIKEIVEPKLDWRELLQRFVSETAKNDYSWSPPNRRFVHAGLYLPSMRSQEIGEIVVAIDTSMSIRQEEIDAFAAEVMRLLEDYKDLTISVIYCDTAIQRVEEFTSRDLPVRMNPKGGGGTDFRPPFTWIDEQGKNPACMIYLTDGRCSRYPNPPGFPVLWVGTQEFTPFFGEVVSLSID